MAYETYSNLMYRALLGGIGGSIFGGGEQAEEGKVYKGIPGIVKPVEILEDSVKLVRREDIHNRVMSFLK